MAGSSHDGRGLPKSSLRSAYVCLFSCMSHRFYGCEVGVVRYAPFDLIIIQHAVAFRYICCGMLDFR